MMAGDAQTGVSIMRLVAELDAGPVYAQQPEPIRRPTTTPRSRARLQRRLGQAAASSSWRPTAAPTPQPEDGVTYAEKITAEDRTLDLHALAGGERPDRPRAAPAHRRAHRAARPATSSASRRRASTSTARCELVTVQPAGGRPMAYAEYLRGHPPAL